MTAAGSEWVWKAAGCDVDRDLWYEGQEWLTAPRALHQSSIDERGAVCCSPNHDNATSANSANVLSTGTKVKQIFWLDMKGLLFDRLGVHAFPGNAAFLTFKDHKMVSPEDMLLLHKSVFWGIRNSAVLGGDWEQTKGSTLDGRNQNSKELYTKFAITSTSHVTRPLCVFSIFFCLQAGPAVCSHQCMWISPFCLPSEHLALSPSPTLCQYTTNSSEWTPLKDKTACYNGGLNCILQKNITMPKKHQEGHPPARTIMYLFRHLTFVNNKRRGCDLVLLIFSKATQMKDLCFKCTRKMHNVLYYNTDKGLYACTILQG